MFVLLAAALIGVVVSTANPTYTQRVDKSRSRWLKLERLIAENIFLYISGEIERQLKDCQATVVFTINDVLPRLLTAATNCPQVKVSTSNENVTYVTIVYCSVLSIYMFDRR